jgi:hypothetical protein
MTDQNAVKKIFHDILRIHENLRKSPEAYGILIVNLLILGMVIFFKPNRYIVIAAYFFETMVIGVFNVIRMIIISIFSPVEKEKPEPLPDKSVMKGFKSPIQMNLFLIVFFILHFGVFYFVQLGLLTGVASDMDHDFPGRDSFLPSPLAFFTVSFAGTGIYTIYAIILMQLFSLVYSFLIKGEYMATNCMVQAIQPYGRILLQQVVVLIGGFIIILVHNAAVFSCILIIIKTFVDIYSQRRHETNVLKRLAET